MSRPGLFSYLFGNPIVSLGSLGFLAWMVYKAYLGQMSYPAVVIVAFGAARCWQCASQLQAYGRWQREWKAMNSKGKGPSLFARAPWLRFPLAVLLWVGVSFAAISHLHGHQHHIAVDAFEIGTMLIAAYAVFAFGRMLTRRFRPSRKWMDVSTCVARPFVTVDARTTSTELPDYCRGLFS